MGRNKEDDHMGSILLILPNNTFSEDSNLQLIEGIIRLPELGNHMVLNGECIKSVSYSQKFNSSQK